MTNITVQIEDDNDLTIFTVEGNITADEVLKYASEYYEKFPTKNVIWDGTNGSVKNISANEFKQIAFSIKNKIGKRAGGKTALVGKFDVDYGSARMYEVYALAENIPVSYKAFRDIKDAVLWLKS